MVFVYPALPLALKATSMLINGVDLFLSSEEGISLKFIAIVLWFSGGPIGIYAGGMAIFGRYSKTVFWLFAYACISYLGIALMLISAGLWGIGTSFLQQLHALYFILSLFILAYQLIIMSEFNKNNVKKKARAN